MEYRQLVSRRLKWFTLIFGLPLVLCASARADGAVDSQCLLVESAFAVNDLNVLESLDLLAPRWQALQSFRLAAIHIPADDKQEKLLLCMRDSKCQANQMQLPQDTQHEMVLVL